MLETRGFTMNTNMFWLKVCSSICCTITSSGHDPYREGLMVKWLNANFPSKKFRFSVTTAGTEGQRPNINMKIRQ